MGAEELSQEPSNVTQSECTDAEADDASHKATDTLFHTARASVPQPFARDHSSTTVKQLQHTWVQTRPQNSRSVHTRAHPSTILSRGPSERQATAQRFT
jgi:hypothetical protein